jgi:hypothetical protein
MERGKLIALIIILVLYIVVIGYLYNVFRQISVVYPTDNQESDLALYSLIRLNQNQITNGETVDLSPGDIVSITIKNVDYSFKLLGINATENKADLVVNKDMFFYLEGDGEKKLDVDKDNYYDISAKIESISEKNVKVHLKMINEKIGVLGIVDSSITKFFERAEKNYNIQLSLILMILVVFLILLVLYIVRSFIAPAVKMKKLKGREKPSDALDYLITEFENAKKTNQKAKAKRLYRRIKHLSRYMSIDDKKKYQAKLKNMERYI